MHNEENEFYHFTEIPKDFHSLESGHLISNCIECDKFLLEDQEYVIEKAIKNYPASGVQDVIFEYAICMDCTERMKEEISEESIASINSYFFSNINLAEITESVSHKPIEEMYEKCLIKGISKDKLDEYQIYAHCKGNKMIKSVFPYMISIEAAMELNDLLSKQTRDFLDGFRERNFNPPPEFEDILNGPKFVFI